MSLTPFKVAMEEQWEQVEQRKIHITFFFCPSSSTFSEFLFKKEKKKNLDRFRRLRAPNHSSSGQGK